MFDVFELPETLEKSFNIAPTQMAWVVSSGATKQLTKMQWGLVSHIAHSPAQHLLINARAETILSKPVFKKAIDHRRCLVPADSFYEWKKMGTKLKQPYRIFSADGDVLYFAGVWEKYVLANDVVSYKFAILTTPPNLEMSAVHNRMPAILSNHTARKIWLSEVDGYTALQSLGTVPDGFLKMYAVSHLVGNVHVNTPALHLPVSEIKTLFD